MQIEPFSDKVPFMDEEHHLEQTFEYQERKEIRQQRQISSRKDRSKFKKTDREKRKKKEVPTSSENLIEGKITAIRSDGIIVSSADSTILCFLRGSLKKERGLNKNIVTIGDNVLLFKTTNEEGVIEHVQERTSTLSRAETLSRKKEQLIAANIDQVLITMSVVIPPIKPTLIDRYLIATEKGNMKPVLVINKIDLLETATDPLDNKIYLECLEAYAEAGIPIISISTQTKEGVDELKKIMKGKSSVFAGQSGVGKSSLINTITGGDLAVGAPTQRTRKGTHTTTSAELIQLEFGGWCIDTPGIRSFGLWDLHHDEVKEYYSDFSPYNSDCYFPNCSHTHEPECKVIEAVEKGKIHPLRYSNYVELYHTLQEEHKPR